MITTVLLDLDDTILDFHKAEKEALKKALQKVRKKGKTADFWRNQRRFGCGGRI